MLLLKELRRRLLEDRGITAVEACDKCGQLLGAIRFTRKNEPGVWCSRECRGDSQQATIRKGGRPRKHADGAAKQQAYRERMPGVTKPSRSSTETKDLQAQKSPLSQYPLNRPFPGRKSAPIENGA